MIKRRLKKYFRECFNNNLLKIEVINFGQLQLFYSYVEYDIQQNVQKSFWISKDLEFEKNEMERILGFIYNCIKFIVGMGWQILYKIYYYRLVIFLIF